MAQIKNIENIVKIINSEAAGFNGHIGIGFKDFGSGEEIYYNGDKKFYAASTFKIFALVAFYDLVMKGQISEKDKYILKKEDIASDGGILKELNPGLELSLEEYAVLMMIISDNAATDIICRIVGFDNIRKAVERIGLADTNIHKNCFQILNDFSKEFRSSERDTLEEMAVRYFSYDYTAVADGLDNTTTPKDVTKTLSMIYNYDILNEIYCKKIINIMGRCQLNWRLPRLLPMDSKVAHKTGSLFGIANDAGIVYSPKGSYSICVYSSSNPRGMLININAYDFIAELSKKVYDKYIEAI